MDYYSKYLKYKTKYNNTKIQQTGGADNIQIRLPSGEWVPAREYQKTAFRRFKNPDNPYRGETRYDYDVNGVTFTINRIGDRYHGGIYMIKEDGSNVPIADWNDVKVFLLDQPVVNWYDSRNYQAWAYYDFIYSNDPTREYKSKRTPGNPNHIEIPIDGISANIIFSISRNDNGTIFYERSDIGRTRTRMSDNQYTRSGYLGYYHRMTDDPGIFVVPAGQVVGQPVAAVGPNNYLPIPPDVVVSQTVNEDIMCVVCNTNKQNIRLLPCKHTNTCSQCYVRIIKPRECPMCRGHIDSIIKYTPIEG